MKKIALLCIVLFGALALNAQGDRPGYLGISIGASIPLGDFADDDENNEDAGFAETGISLQTPFAYKFGETFGLAGNLMFNSNPIAEFDGQEDIDAYWNYFAVLVGPLVSFDLSEKVALDLKATGGYSSSQFSVEAGGFDIDVDGGNGFAYDIGAALRLNLSEKTALLFAADYFSTQQEFDDELFGELENTITSLNASLGFVFRLK